MPFLDEYIEVPLGTRNDKIFQSLGYDIPKRKDKWGNYTSSGFTLKVKVSELPKSSNYFVNYGCDECGKNLRIKLNDYKNHNHNGKYYCVLCSAKIFNSGERSGRWKKDKTMEERIIGREYPEYREFIRKVLARDKYTCQCCGNKKATMEVHHLDGYDWCKEKRTDTTNGITLCESCHLNFHGIYGMGGNTKAQFEEWFKKSLDMLSVGADIIPLRLIRNLSTGEVMTSEEICKKYNAKAKPYACCNLPHRQFKGMILIWNDIYEKMSEQELQEYIKSKECIGNKIKCKCIETNEVFPSITQGAKKYGLCPSSLHKVVRKINGRTACGELNGMPLHWELVS